MKPSRSYSFADWWHFRPSVPPMYVRATICQNAPMTDYVSLRIGPKFRLVLPAALRRASGIDVGSELVGHVDVEGRIVFETASSAQARVWAGAPPSQGDSQADIRRSREVDRTIEAENAARRADSHDDSAAGVRLLASLGL